MPLGRNLDRNPIAFAAVGSDERKAGVATSNLAVDRVNDAAASAMHRVKINLVQSVPHAASSTIATAVCAL